jgi:hypothetical protein
MLNHALGDGEGLDRKLGGDAAEARIVHVSLWAFGSGRSLRRYMRCVRAASSFVVRLIRAGSSFQGSRIQVTLATFE